MGLVCATDIIGHEIDITTVIDMIGESLDVCVLNPGGGQQDAGRDGKDRGGSGIFVTRMTRQGHEIRLLADTVINKHDMLHLVGSRPMSIEPPGCWDIPSGPRLSPTS